MIIVFVDTNVILDLILEREGFFEEAAMLFHLRDEGRLEIYISSLSLATIAYFAKKFKRDPREIVNKILKWVHLIPLQRKYFEYSILSQFKDFEDALQYYSACEVKGIDAIITRNKKDFLSSEIKIFEPEEFLKLFVF